MKTLLLTLANDLTTMDIEFDIFDSSIAQRWAKEVSKGYPIYEADRFKGWPNSKKDVKYYHIELIKQVDIVNTYAPNTIDIINREFDQDFLNYLHKFFEQLRGPTVEGTEFFNTAPSTVQDAILKFNVLIHELEHILRNPEHPTIVCTFKDRSRIALDSSDYKEFTFKWKFGYVYINYCEVGKPLLDVFKDQDTVVGLDNIRPLKFYSADFMIKFGPDTPEDVYSQRLDLFYKWYNEQPYKFEELSLGLIPVAKIKSLDNVVNRISHFNRIKEVCIK